MAKKNWNKIKNRDQSEDPRYRDVYEDQQFERGDIQPLKKPTSRYILTIILTLLVMLTVHSIISGINFLSFMWEFKKLQWDFSDLRYMEQDNGDAENDYEISYWLLDEEGNRVETHGYDNPDDVPVPQWYTDKADVIANINAANVDFKYFMKQFTMGKIFIDLIVGALFFSIFIQIMLRNLDAQNLMNSTEDINQYKDDQHVALPEEVMKKFDWFPDVGAHSSVSVSSMISHVMLDNKGINKVDWAKRATEDIVDSETGTISYYKGEVLFDEEGSPIMTHGPLFDKDFGEDLFETSGAPKKSRKWYSPKEIEYNKGNMNRDKLKGYNMVSDMINGDWELPLYEPQRPAGAYLVDTAPVNTMVLAITRAGKGQTVIEPTIDMWTREKNPGNIVINDPKGELLVKNYVKSTVRGFQVVQFNLINAMKTDIYNPLALAADAAREGDFKKCAAYVGNIADVFFPMDGGEDPVWPTAANNAFKRAAYGLIDYYLEEEKELRHEAAINKTDPAILETKIDELWGKVTLYNCYQLFVQMSSKKVVSPLKLFKTEEQMGTYNIEGDAHDRRTGAKLVDAATKEIMHWSNGSEPLTDEEFIEREDAAKMQHAEYWDNKPEMDMLSLFFNATDRLPRNEMRRLVADTNNSLKAMGGAEKMMASVYGIAISAMSFFTDPTISTLTSGTPSQNVDLAGISFPRRLGVRFRAEYIQKYHLLGMQARWQAYSDDMFTNSLGNDFYHTDIITREGWAKYYFKGIFPETIAYIKLEILNPITNNLISVFYFEFKKAYQTSLNGCYYIKDPVLGEKIIKNGSMKELLPVYSYDANKKRFIDHFEAGHVQYHGKHIVEPSREAHVVDIELTAISQTMIRYSEKPKILFLVTPPHLMQYAKIILILIKQLVDLNFDQSYMTKSNQKPLYKTRFMLDELGNLQSEGHGIQNFETMLSIGLGQDQQFTIILQTLQQLRDVYGDSVDKIVQGNAQPLDSLIATPCGWKRMRDIAVGDQVLTPYGDITTVTGVYPKGVRPVYRVTLRDGSSTECCNQHLWEIERYKTTVEYKGVDEDGRKIYTAPEGGKTCELVREVIDTDELKRRVDKGRQINLPKIKPVMYDAVSLPIHPYVMGVILGDGQIDKKGHVTLTVAKKDREILDKIRSVGYELTRSNKKDESKTPVYYLKGVTKIMRDLGLAGHRSWEKFIPIQYLYSSVEQRIDLLRGIMDTDGTISKKGEMEFTSSSYELAEDVQSIIRSLGGRVGINTKENVMYTSPNQKTKKKARVAYRVQNIRLFDINPFCLARKAERWVCRTDNSGNRVVLVEYLRDDEVQCIKVADERHLYVTDDYIPTHNTSNIIFLKSTDDSMIDTLKKMSGTTHKTFIHQKVITRDMEKLFLKNEGKVSYTSATLEVPVISYNDFAFISERNSIVLRAGDSPIWNRNETILPMSWRLFENTIIQPGKEYSLQTIPTLSSAIDFDVRKNQPDFTKMFKKRFAQSLEVEEVEDIYRNCYHYDDYEFEQLDPDVYADEIMEMINERLKPVKNPETPDDESDFDEDAEQYYQNEMKAFYDKLVITQNKEQEVANRQIADNYAKRTEKKFAGKLIAPCELYGTSGVSRSLENIIKQAYVAVKADMENDHAYFTVRGQDLYDSSGEILYISRLNATDDLAALNAAAKDPKSKVYADGKGDASVSDLTAIGSYQITDAFFKFLANQPSWSFAGGRFDKEMERLLKE